MFTLDWFAAVLSACAAWRGLVHGLLYGAINAPYFLISNIVSCAILTAMA